MAYEKQNWKDALQAAKPERSGQDDSANQREQKKKSRIMYNRRKLEKDVKHYIHNTNGPIKGSDIERIGRKHGVFVT